MAKLYEEILTHRNMQKNPNTDGNNTLELSSFTQRDVGGIGPDSESPDKTQNDDSHIGGSNYIYPGVMFGHHAKPTESVPGAAFAQHSTYSLHNDSLSSLGTHIDHSARLGLYQQYESKSLDNLPQRTSNLSSRSETSKRKLGLKNAEHEGGYHPQSKPVKMAKPQAIRQSSFPAGAKKFPVAYDNTKSLSTSPKKESLFTANDEFERFFNFSHDDMDSFKYNNGLSKKNKVEGSVINSGLKPKINGFSADVSQRKNKKPGFHIPLNNIGGMEKGYVANNPTFRPAGFHSYTHSDSSIEKSFPGSSNELSFEDNDLLFHEDDKLIYGNIITPSMKPPGTNQDNYFELDSEFHVKGTSPPQNQSTNQLTNESEVQTKEMESYLVTNYSEMLKDSVSPLVNNSTDEFHPDLSGFNFDVNPKTNESSPGDFLNLVNFEDGSSTGGIDKNSEPVSESVDNDKDGSSKPYFLNLTKPTFERTGSSQSVTSSSSISSKDRERQKKKRTPKGAVCTICDKYISRDLTRHMRIHNEVGRFQCVYPKSMCNHKTQYFNRPYDYKKHLLHVHFKFDDPKGKSANTLTDKLPMLGTCVACGSRFVANDWLENHILIDGSDKRCSYLEHK